MARKLASSTMTITLSKKVSSAGRIFDAVAALVGVPGSRQVTYEGQAAVELELAARSVGQRSYPFRLRDATPHPPAGVRNTPLPSRGVGLRHDIAPPTVLFEA